MAKRRTTSKTERDYIWLTPNKKPPVILTERQGQVIDLLCEGYRIKQIAYELGISEIRVNQILIAVRKKLSAKTNAQVIYLLISNSDFAKIHCV